MRSESSSEWPKVCRNSMIVAESRELHRT